ncbi:MAG: SIS domain-containing protein [Patescibacteria group bacterium]
MPTPTSFTDLADALQRLSTNQPFLEALEKATSLVREALLGGHKLLIAGNGGSAAEADHFAAEIVGHYMRVRKGYPAITLSTSAATVTAIGNDDGYEEVFARQVQAYGLPGDVVIGITTSGNSKNIIRALEQAREMGLKTVCFLGRDGGALREVPNVSLLVPETSTARIQELHLLAIHTICESVDQAL